MNQNILLALAATGGLVAGAGGTWFAVSSSSNETRAFSKAEITAAIEADPSLCPAPLAPPPAPKTSELVIPTEAEALAAFRKAQESSPLVWDRDQLPEVSLTLGQCDTNNSGPGVACMTTIKLSLKPNPKTALSVSPNPHQVNGLRDRTRAQEKSAIVAGFLHFW